MSTNRLFGPLLTVVIVGVVALTIRESVATSAVVGQARAQEAQFSQRSQDAETARWLAAARFYERQASEESLASLTGSSLIKPLTSYDAAEAMAYRWQAMATFYQKHPEIGAGTQLSKPLTVYDAGEASAYRWQAIYNYYVLYGLARIR
jgi:hypothetical protein